MPPSPRNVKFPNGFYVVLLLTSTVFVMTILAWLVAPALRQIQKEDQAQGTSAPRVDDRSLAMADWIDKNAVNVLTYELGVILATGFLAVGFDAWQEKRQGKQQNS